MAKKPSPVQETKASKFVIQIMVTDPDSGLESEVEIRKDVQTGLMVGIDRAAIHGIIDIPHPYHDHARLNISREG